MPKVYLGGRISGLSYAKAQAPRKEARRILERFYIEVVDPMEKERRLAGTACLNDLESAVTLGKEFDDIIAWDEEAIARSDYYLLLTGDSPSWGTGIEAGHAYYNCGIPIVSVGNTDPPSGWLIDKSEYVASSVLTGCLWIIAAARGFDIEAFELFLNQSKGDSLE